MNHRYIGRLVFPIALMGALFTGFYAGRFQVTVVHAQRPVVPVVLVPKAWGTFKGCGPCDKVMVFEDGSGILRLVDPNSGFISWQINRSQ
jgi:hypothetical protein